jgi:hypothetical protein
MNEWLENNGNPIDLILTWTNYNYRTSQNNLRFPNEF